MKKEEFMKYANSFQAVARLRLEGIGELCGLLGNPQDKLKFIHISGTNGKGSVCAFLQSALTAAGLVTGKYISPNMLRVNERISVDGEEIPQADLERILSRVNSAAKEMSEMPTQFEIWTAAAFYWFAEKGCDTVVLETGLGGTCDATNIVKNTVACAITRIAVEHTEYLGNTIEEIASAKAGIIKEGARVYTVNTDKKILDVIRAACDEKKAGLTVASDYEVLGFDGEYEHFSCPGLENAELSMLGVHQIENAALAAAVLMGLGIAEDHIRCGLREAKNIGRFERIGKKLLFDGAHNENGMTALVNGLNRYFPSEKKAFIMGFMGDKAVNDAVRHLKKVSGIEKAVFYTVMVKDNPRAMSAEGLAELLRENGFEAYPEKSISSAYEKAEGESGLVVICGSLYLYKDLAESGIAEI